MSKKTNIIYILADDMGYGDMSCNNPDSKFKTPNLDSLAADGMRFTDAHAASSVCTPSRYSILTGRYCWRTELKNSVLWPWDASLMEDEHPTVAKMLKDNGYDTCCIGKWHLGLNWETFDGSAPFADLKPGEHDGKSRADLEANIDYSKPFRGGPVDCGFNYYFGVDVPNFPPYTWFENDHLTHIPTVKKPDDMFGAPGTMKEDWELKNMIPEFVKRVEKYIIETNEDKPFFLYFPLTSPHTPCVPNDEFIGKSGVDKYADFVLEVDWVVGKVIEALKQKGIYNETMIVFTSDNGPELEIGGKEGQQGVYNRAKNTGHYSMGELRGIKRDTWEGGHRVPFIVKGPDVPEGVTCDELMGLNDFMKSCAEMLDISVPEGSAEDSVSAWGLMSGKEEKTRRTNLIHHSCSGDFAIRSGNWVFIDHSTGDDVNAEPQWFKNERGYKAHNCPGELFKLDADLQERENLYEKHPEKVKELKSTLEKIKRQS
jgi:arylsulfatase A